jgi:hypothetical protein
MVVYSYGHYPKPKHLAHPQDCSVMTYRGHQVLQTLIRCQFSPIETTGGQYLYSGSSDGRIHVSIIPIPGCIQIYCFVISRYGLLMAELSKFLTGHNVSRCPWMPRVLNQNLSIIYITESVCAMLAGTLRYCLNTSTRVILPLKPL